MDVYGAAFAVEGVAPNGVEDLVAVEDCAALFQEQAKKLKLFERERNGFARMDFRADLWFFLQDIKECW